MSISVITECKIKWIDDDTEEAVLIKSNNVVGDDDDKIFFYGMSRRKCIDAMKNGIICEGEWQIIEVY